MSTSWIDDFPPPPSLGDPMPLPERRPDTLAYLAHRRSLTAAQMQDPGPDTDELGALLRIAARVPDHRRVHPFRFLTFTGDARAAFGDVLADAFKASREDPAPEAVELERGRFLRAPVVVAVISSVQKEHSTPEWEQILTAGAVAQNLVIAAGAAGYAAQWLT
ncbi:MAG: nitroreductase family protein, partial [Pseudomonadota bacterium]